MNLRPEFVSAIEFSRVFMPPKKESQPRLNFIDGSQFRTVPFFDLSQTGEGPSLSDKPTDAEKLTRDLNQLATDSKLFRKFHRKKP